jgi:hypothetical protein
VEAAEYLLKKKEEKEEMEEEEEEVVKAKKGRKSKEKEQETGEEAEEGEKKVVKKRAPKAEVEVDPAKVVTFVFPANVAHSKPINVSSYGPNNLRIAKLLLFCFRYVFKLPSHCARSRLQGSPRKRPV